jgi:excisionase family DNA binding protein
MADALEALTLTPQQAATKLGIGRASMYALLRQGRVPSVRLGRIYRVPVRVLEEMLARPESLSLPDGPTGRRGEATR